MEWLTFNNIMLIIILAYLIYESNFKEKTFRIEDKPKKKDKDKQ